MTVAIVLLQAYLGFTFLGAAYGKARSALRGEQRRAIAIGSLVVTETVAGVVLLAGVFARSVAGAVAVFLAAGVAIKAVRRWRNAHAMCECLGDPRRIDAAELTAGCVQVVAATTLVLVADGGVMVSDPRATIGAALAVAYLAAAIGFGVHRGVRVRLDTGSSRSA